jgi:hypothetical protein
MIMVYLSIFQILKNTSKTPAKSEKTPTKKAPTKKKAPAKKPSRKTEKTV